MQRGYSPRRRIKFLPAASTKPGFAHIFSKIVASPTASIAYAAPECIICSYTIRFFKTIVYNPHRRSRGGASSAAAHRSLTSWLKFRLRLAVFAARMAITVCSGLFFHHAPFALSSRQRNQLRRGQPIYSPLSQEFAPNGE
jgi:hypothetical protein